MALLLTGHASVHFLKNTIKELERKIKFCSCRLHVQWGYFCYEAYHVSVADPGFEQWGVDGREFACAFVARKNFADHRHISAFLLHFNS